AANFSTVRARFTSRATIDFLAMTLPLTFKREVERFQQSASLFVVPCTSGNTDIQTAQLIDLIVIYLGKNNLLTDTHGKVSPAIELIGANTPEISNTRNSNGNQAIQKLVHPILPQRYFATNRPSIADLESGDRFARCGYNGFLPTNLFQVADSVIQDRSEERRVGKEWRSRSESGQSIRRS